eukprot:Skav236071  [mRNA]  locus=scaffold2211:153024:160283:+ [translate_table: standard]
MGNRTKYLHRQQLGILAGKDDVVLDVILGTDVSNILVTPELIQRWDNLQYQIMGLVEFVEDNAEVHTDMDLEHIQELFAQTQKPLLMIRIGNSTDPKSWMFHDDNDDASAKLTACKLDNEGKKRRKNADYRITPADQLGVTFEDEAAFLVSQAICNQMGKAIAKHSLDSKHRFEKVTVPADGYCFWHSILASLQPKKYCSIERCASGWPVNKRQEKVEAAASKHLLQLAVNAGLDATEFPHGYVHLDQIALVAAKLNLAVRCTISDEAFTRLLDSELRVPQDAVHGRNRPPDVHVYFHFITGLDGRMAGHYDMIMPDDTNVCCSPIWLPPTTTELVSPPTPDFFRTETYHGKTNTLQPLPPGRLPPSEDFTQANIDKLFNAKHLKEDTAPLAIQPSAPQAEQEQKEAAEALDTTGSNASPVQLAPHVAEQQPADTATAEAMRRTCDDMQIEFQSPAPASSETSAPTGKESTEAAPADSAKQPALPEAKPPDQQAQATASSASQPTGPPEPPALASPETPAPTEQEQKESAEALDTTESNASPVQLAPHVAEQQPADTPTAEAMRRTCDDMQIEFQSPAPASSETSAPTGKESTEAAPADSAKQPALPEAKPPNQRAQATASSASQPTGPPEPPAPASPETLAPTGKESNEAAPAVSAKQPALPEAKPPDQQAQATASSASQPTGPPEPPAPASPETLAPTGKESTEAAPAVSAKQPALPEAKPPDQQAQATASSASQPTGPPEPPALASPETPAPTEQEQKESAEALDTTESNASPVQLAPHVAEQQPADTPTAEAMRRTCDDMQIEFQSPAPASPETLAPTGKESTEAAPADPAKQPALPEAKPPDQQAQATASSASQPTGPPEPPALASPETPAPTEQEQKESAEALDTTESNASPVQLAPHVAEQQPADTPTAEAMRRTCDDMQIEFQSPAPASSETSAPTGKESTEAAPADPAKQPALPEAKPPDQQAQATASSASQPSAEHKAGDEKLCARLMQVLAKPKDEESNQEDSDENEDEQSPKQMSEQMTSASHQLLEPPSQEPPQIAEATPPAASRDNEYQDRPSKQCFVIRLERDVWLQLLETSQHKTIVCSWKHKLDTKTKLLVVENSQQGKVVGEAQLLRIQAINNLSDLRKTNEWRTAPQSHKEAWRKRLVSSNKSIYRWEFEHVHEFAQPMQAPKCRGRSFWINTNQLKPFAAAALPDPDLGSTCKYFVDRLSPEDRNRLGQRLRDLDGRTITFGSTCSGTDVDVCVMKHTFGKLNQLFNVMREDMHNLGYVMEWSKMSAQDYILPQRRNRVYATADIHGGQCAMSYHEHMKTTLQSMASDALLPFHTVFDTSLPKQCLEGKLEDKLEEALQKACVDADSQNVFIDTAGGKGRTVESAVNMLTCVRPSHKIYSQQLQRFVTVPEMWTAQGLFKHNFDNPDAIENIWKTPSKAKDLAGNAFASTCMQSKLLASLIHSHGWVNVMESEPTVGTSVPTSSAMVNGESTDSLEVDTSILPTNVSPTEILHTPSRKSTSSTSLTESRGKKRSPSFSLHGEQEETSVATVQSVPKRRCRGKTKPEDAMQARLQPSNGIMEFEKICADPDIRFKEKHFLSTGARSGAYQGCFSKSHWGGQRQKQRWDLLMQHAPKIAKTHSEVPNYLRGILNIDKMKWNGSKFSEKEGLHTVPPPLATALEHLVMDRLEIGEEITYDFVEQTLRLLVKLWNEKISDLENEVREAGQKRILERENARVDLDGLADAERTTSESDVSALQNLLGALQTCNVQQHPSAFGKLALCINSCCFCSL